MVLFNRAFDISVLEKHLARAPTGVMHQLLAKWALPGESGAPSALRLAVRNGYLNFYVGGQSVARVDAGRRGLRLTTHQKYFEGWREGTGAAKAGKQALVLLANDDLLGPKVAAKVDGWIETAFTYCGLEKRFVDELIAANRNVVDVEMALPGDKALLNEHGKLVAPRMDLVTVVDGESGPILNFWEAKCADNPELRAEAEIDLAAKTGAKVTRQVERYVAWLGITGRAEQVSAAYQKAGGVLRNLAGLAGKSADHPAVAAWDRLASKAPALVHKPGIVVGNYTPVRPRLELVGDDIAKRAQSFEKHREKLIAHGLVVHEVSAADAMPVLPRLQA